MIHLNISPMARLKHLDYKVEISWGGNDPDFKEIHDKALHNLLVSMILSVILKMNNYTLASFPPPSLHLLVWFQCIVCIGIPPFPKKHLNLFLTNSPLKSSKFPSPPFLGNSPRSYHECPPSLENLVVGSTLYFLHKISFNLFVPSM